MEKIERLLKFAFSTDFLLKLLIIAGILAILKIADGNFYVRIDHYHNSGYGGFEVKIKEGQRP